MRAPRVGWRGIVGFAVLTLSSASQARWATLEDCPTFTDFNHLRFSVHRDGSYEYVTEFQDEIKNEKGRLDTIFANAGGGGFLPLGDSLLFYCRCRALRNRRRSIRLSRSRCRMRRRTARGMRRSLMRNRRMAFSSSSSYSPSA